MGKLLLTPFKRGYHVIGGLDYKDISVPDKFFTDGITAKKIKLVYLFINKFDPRVIEAVVVHDYLCELGEYEKADRYFEEMLPDIWQKWWMVRAVKRYHDIKVGK